MSAQRSAEVVARERHDRATVIAAHGGLEQAIANGALPRRIETTLAEALVLGLLRQQVQTFIGVLGHGSTEIGEVLRVYAGAGLVRMLGVRSEIEASHAAMALRWATGEKAAVITSIGPGALQAMAASLAPASDGVGVWYLLGDETSEDEGPNMQQIPKPEQQLFLRVAAAMGQGYVLHTPAAVGTALERGLCAVDHPYRAGPFFLLMPLNTQPATIAGFNLDELPVGAPPASGAACDEAAYAEAVAALGAAERVVVKVGGGGRGAGEALTDFLELADAVAVLSPIAIGAVPYAHPRNMLVGGSKGTLSGNYAMEQADLLVAIGTRGVCQADCSRTGYPRVKRVININADLATALHYRKSIALVGDAAATLRELNRRLRASGVGRRDSAWLTACAEQRRAWEKFKEERYAHPTLFDPMWQREVLTQPAAIKTATDWARARGAVCFFDAGDVQANGFQICEDARLGQSFTETGASYMGFAASALLATGMARTPFFGLAISGDGSFTMSPQVLIDGVAHGTRGCILLLDNRRMAAISGLQKAQYGEAFATADAVPVDYVAWARAVAGVEAIAGGTTPASLVAALDRAHAHGGLSLVHVPVYYGDDPLGGMGVYGRWNVGNWVDATQALRHEIGL